MLDHAPVELALHPVVHVLVFLVVVLALDYADLTRWTVLVQDTFSVLSAQVSSHVASLSIALARVAAGTLVQLTVVVVKIILIHMSLRLHLVQNSFLSIRDHVKTLEVIVLLVGKVKAFESPSCNKLCKRHSMIRVFNLTHAGAALTWTSLLKLHQQVLLLPRDLVAHRSLVADQILELFWVSLDLEYTRFFILVLLLKKSA